MILVPVDTAAAAAAAQDDDSQCEVCGKTGVPLACTDREGWWACTSCKPVNELPAEPEKGTRSS